MLCSYLNSHLSQTSCAHHEKSHSSNFTEKKKKPIPLGLFYLDSLWNFWGMLWALFPVLNCWIITLYWILPKMCWIETAHSCRRPVVFTIHKGTRKRLLQLPVRRWGSPRAGENVCADHFFFSYVLDSFLKRLEWTSAIALLWLPPTFLSLCTCSGGGWGAPGPALRSCSGAWCLLSSFRKKRSVEVQSYHL